MIPVIDLFAGPGGLGEGFSSRQPRDPYLFKIKLSIEKDEHAHRTLELRAFFRNFPKHTTPDEYYEYLRGNLAREELFRRFPDEASAARDEAWHATLGTPQLPKKHIDERIQSALAGVAKWVLIGGPPCQAYSLVGRSRVIGKEGREEYERDPRHTLYRQYLRILAMHRPPIFVMENVKGLLSARRRDEHTFERMLADLQKPGRRSEINEPDLEYRLYSIVKRSDDGTHTPEDFVVRSERYGVPQARHRIILLGIRADLKTNPACLVETRKVSVKDVLRDFPKVRSGLSKGDDSAEAWVEAIRSSLRSEWVKELPDELRNAVNKIVSSVRNDLTRGSEFIEGRASPIPRLYDWYTDQRLFGVCNHSTRGHIEEDLHRYLYCAVFAECTGKSPILDDFPPSLLPQHQNVLEALNGSKFNDRFRVQVAEKPSTTVTSHISKDGHYFIHYDPTQCRSLTVREAARLQTFPDNYFFEGPRTQQYHQVGNAVPPLLAKQIAEIVAGVLQ